MFSLKHTLKKTTFMVHLCLSANPYEIDSYGNTEFEHLFPLNTCDLSHRYWSTCLLMSFLTCPALGLYLIVYVKWCELNVHLQFSFFFFVIFFSSTNMWSKVWRNSFKRLVLIVLQMWNKWIDILSFYRVWKMPRGIASVPKM